MKTRIHSLAGRLAVAAALLVTATGAFAQTPGMAGQWQGTLSAGPQQLRLVFVVSVNAAGGSLTAMVYSIDQGAGGVAANATAQGAAVRFTIAAIGGTFEGKLAADGNSIAGTWSQGGGSVPLMLERATKETAWPLPAPPRAMAADAPAVFDVVSIRPSNPNTPGKLFTVKGRQVLTINTTLSDLITFAYNLHARQIQGGPSWMEEDKFDIIGQPQAEGVPNQEQLRAMIRGVLQDRFRLATHQDKRELPAYALVVANSGPKLTRNDTNPNGLPALLFKGLGMLPAVNASMGDFARTLQLAVLDRPVVDRTGLQGRFDFTLRWTPDESQFRSMGVRIPPPPDDPNAPPGLFTAVQEQLGLRLESTNAPVDVLVIDGVEKPSEN
jgi:uncharacterized protein (TIGR03435 family)